MRTLQYFHWRRVAAEGNSRSSALILALIFIGLISVLVIGFLASMRSETFSAHSHLNGVAADIYADAGNDMAMSKLYTALYTPLQGAAATFNPTNYWVSQPGRIFTSSPGGSVTTNYDLSSGGWASTTAPTSDQGVDLNPVSFEGGGRIVSATNGDLYVSWIYQHQNGTLDATAPPVYSASNPVVGRFAYWVDDEGVKVNINTAWDRAGNTNIASHPSQINLEALSTADAAAIHNYRVAGTNFNSVAEVGLAGVTSATTQNGFSLTAYNHSPDLNVTNMAGTPQKPDLNMFGEQRIMLTTQKRYADAAGCTNFLDVLATENTDPGSYASLSASGVNTTVIKLNAALSRTDFPFLPAKSFSLKYGTTLTPIMALNIIDYVRSAESTNQCITPIRGDSNPPGFTIYAAPSNGAVISNCGRRPYITAFGIVLKGYAAGSPNGTATFDSLFSVYVPPVIPGGDNNDIKIDSTTLYLYDAMEHIASQKVTSVLAVGSPTALGADSFLHGGQYATLVHTWTLSETAQPATMGQVGTFAVSPYPSPGPHLNQKLTDSQTNTISLPAVDHNTNTTDVPLGPTTDDTSSAATAYEISNDPAAGKWQTANSPLSPGIFGAPWGHATNTTLGALPASITPKPDTDASGHVANGMFVPAPKGTPSNPLGVVYSVGELGFISTTGNNTGVNWRTLRLQPQNQTGVLPDWALLDLFTVPQSGIPVSTQDQPFSQPYNVTGVPYAGGKININNAAYQLIDSTTGNQLFRPIPLEALLLKATNSYPDPNVLVPTAPTTVSSATAATLATNIAFGLPATGGTIYGTNAAAGSTNFYWSPYQLAEIKGVADGGEGSEVIFRQLSGLMTTHSDVYTIYSVGQSIRQTSSGVTVLGERRKQTTVERFVNSSGAVVLQPVTSKDIQP